MIILNQQIKQLPHCTELTQKTIHRKIKFYKTQLKVISLVISGCRLKCTGQLFAVWTRILRSFSEAWEGKLNWISIFEILLGSEAMCFVTSAVALVKSVSISRDLIPIIVRIQLARPVATVSVGENACPNPIVIDWSISNERIARSHVLT